MKETRAAVRAADTDRETVMQALGDALAEGRLDTDEYRRRLDTAATAVTLPQLHALTADLPVSRAELDRAEAARKAAKDRADLREWIDEWWGWLIGAAIMTGIWGVTSYRAGEPQFYWPAVPLGIWAAILICVAFTPSDRSDGDG